MLNVRHPISITIRLVFVLFLDPKEESNYLHKVAEFVVVKDVLRKIENSLIKINKIEDRNITERDPLTHLTPEDPTPLNLRKKLEILTIFNIPRPFKEY